MYIVICNGTKLYCYMPINSLSYLIVQHSFLCVCLGFGFIVKVRPTRAQLVWWKRDVTAFEKLYI